MIYRRFGLYVMAVLLACGMGLAQLDTATILGTVLDSSGAVIPGAEVVVQNMGTSVKLNLVTDLNGNFTAPLLPVGSYRVTASKTGFKSEVQENIHLSAYDRISLSFSLAPGVVSEQITVLGQETLVQTATSTSGGVVSTEAVESLPINGRTATSLMAVIPGMMMEGAYPSINGMSDLRIQQAGIRYQVDGGDASTVDMDGAVAGYGVGRINKIGMDAIQEVNMVTDSYSAEFGATSGALINYITKSGTNDFHGTLFEFFRNEILDARNYFDPAPFYKPAYRLNQFGGSLGGPIKREKLFFFANYEAVRQRTGAVFDVLVPTQAFRETLAPVLQPAVNMLPLPNGGPSADPRLAYYTTSRADMVREDSWVAKIDYQMTTKDRLTVRSSGDDTYAQTYFGVGLDQYSPNPNTPQTAKIGYTRAIRGNVYNELAAFFNRMTALTPNAGSNEVVNFPEVNVGGGMAMIGPTAWNMSVHNTSYTLMDALSWVKGRHQLKFGAQARRDWDNKGVAFENYLTFVSLDDFAANAPYSLRTEGWPIVGMRGTEYSFFVQDDVKATRKLTLNLGLRYQYDTVPTESHGRMANFNFTTGMLDPVGTPILNPPKRNIAPRVGFAYSPWSSNRTVIRGGVGLLYMNIQYSLPQWLPANIPTVGYDRFVTSIDDPSLVGFPTPDISGILGVPDLQAMQRDWKTPYTEQWSLNVQQQLGASNLLQVGYVGNHTVHLIPGYGNEENPYIPGTVPLRRTYPGFGMITTQTTCCNANYNALQVSFKHQLNRGLTLGVNYTWSHALDEATGITSSAFQDHSNPSADYATADWNQTHTLVFYYTYHIPAAPRVPAWLGGGWQINGITTMHSGEPVNIYCSTCNAGGAGVVHSVYGIFTGRPNLVPGVSLRPANYSLPTNQVNLAAFTTPPDDGYGNAGRNLMRGPAAFNWDFSLFKDFRVREGQSFEFRLETFNLFNTPQFSNPASDIASPATFGQSFSTNGTLGGFGTQRQLQFALKYVF